MTAPKLSEITSEEMQALDRASAGCSRRDDADSPLLTSLHEKLCDIRALAPTSGEGVDDYYVAWMRYSGQSIVACDSDAPRAFKVYRHPAPQSAPVDGDSRKLRELRSLAMKAMAELVQLGEPDSLTASFKARKKWPRELVERERVVDIVMKLRHAMDNMPTTPPPASQERGGMDAEHWAELHRLRIERVESVSGKTWQELAATERIARIKAEKSQAVILPKPIETNPLESEWAAGITCGWNACLKEIGKLNLSPPSSAAEGPKCLHCGLVGGGPCMFDGCPNRPDAAEQAKPNDSMLQAVSRGRLLAIQRGLTLAHEWSNGTGVHGSMNDAAKLMAERLRLALSSQPADYETVAEQAQAGELPAVADVQRYAMQQRGDYVDMWPHPNGEYVKFTDYDQLRQRVAEAEAEAHAAELLAADRLAKLALAEQDARRYRFIRDNPVHPWVTFSFDTGVALHPKVDTHNMGPWIDAATDAAIDASGEGHAD